MSFTMSNQLSLDALKIQAKTLRQNMADINQTITHSESLELIAKQKGFKDWNCLHAHIGNQQKPNFVIGQRVKGHYLGQKFAGILLKATPSNNAKRYGITVRFDEAVDVIRFEGMSNWRKQVQITINQDGQTNEKTSDGSPHMVIEVCA